ncbi:MAG: hypothetical protein E7271_13055 [Lachnospiraceae bacterium]|jgi:hypothetical protein|nr:hypothetical protein [Lachnospiraceae bacterium]
MKKQKISFLIIALLFSFIMIPSLKVSAAVAPQVPTGLQFAEQSKNKFWFGWDVDTNIIYYGAYGYYGYEVVVSTTKGKVIKTVAKDSLNNQNDTNVIPDSANNRLYVAVENGKLSKQAFKVKVRAYVFDESGNKLYSGYTAEKVIVPRANVKSLKATSRSTGLIKWQKVKGAKSYSVYVSSNGGTKFKRQATVSGTSYTVKGMKLSKQYYVYVVANGVKVKKKKFNSTKPMFKKSNASTIEIYLRY